MGSVFLSVCAAVLALQAAGLARAQNALATEPPPAAICGLEGFHLNTLQLADSWSFSLTDKTHCIIPHGATEDDVLSCTIAFSVCKPLHSCGGLSNSSTCEEVTLRNGNKFQFDIGDYRGNNEFDPLADDTFVGFTAIRESSQPVNGRVCNLTYSTVIVWKCDDKKIWNPSAGDANAYFIESTFDPAVPCILKINLGFNGACYSAPTLAPDTCQLEPYNFVGLSTHDYWTASVSSDMCYDSGISACKIYISFCGALPLSIGTGCYGAAVCQDGTRSDGGSYSYSMGLYSTAKYAANKGDVGGGFHLDVVNGSVPDDGKCAHLGGIRTRIVLSCNPSAKWTNQDLGSNFHIEYFRSVEPCEYNIALQYYGACEPVGPIEPGSGSKPQSFVGWILIGIFFFVVMVYLFVGAGFQYFVKGARGVEVIPNYPFWVLFLSLVLEGCKFSFNAITCFKFEDKIKSPFSGPGKSGIDYDKI